MNGMELMAPAHSQFPSAHSSDLLLPAATASVENASRTNTSPAHSNQEPNLAPGLQLKISGIDELLASLIIDNGVGEPTEFHGIAGEQILHPITDDCKEIVLCIETQCRQIYDDPDVATANIAIELVETWNGVTRTAAALKKKKLDRFFKAQREHALHPMDPVYDHEGQTHYKWGAFRTQDRLRKDLEVAETCDTVLEATPALRSIIQDQRFLYCWRGFSSNRRYRSLSLNSDNGYMGRDYTASYIEDQAVSIVTTHLDRFRFTIIAMDPVEWYEIGYRNSVEHVSMSVKCYLETASIMHHVRPLIKQTIGNSLADQEATDDSVHDYRALYIAKRVLAQQREALFEFSTSLDDIELNLGDERMFLLVLPRWTKVFPDWRNHLMHTEAHLAYLCHSLSRRPTASAPASRGDFAEVIELAKRLQSAVISYRTRLEMTCQVISILTGVVSADRSLQEADGVAKLSHLAFFFVPLGLVAALFSMDIAQFQDNNIRVWVATSAATLLIAYLLRYGFRIWRFFNIVASNLRIMWHIRPLWRKVYFAVLLICLTVVLLCVLGRERLFYDKEAGRGAIEIAVICLGSVGLFLALFIVVTAVNHKDAFLPRRGLRFVESRLV